jgi:hypothetical protein
MTLADHEFVAAERWVDTKNWIRPFAGPFDRPRSA